jgi:hypothetical protein
MRALLLLLLFLLALAAGACADAPTPLPEAVLVQASPPVTAPPPPEAAPLVIAADTRLESAFSSAFPAVDLLFLEARPLPDGIDGTSIDAWIGLDRTDDSIDCLLRLEIGLSLSEDAAALVDAPDWLAAFTAPANPTAIRVLLANAGYPDGLSIPVDGIDWVTNLWNEQLRGSGIELQPAQNGSLGYTWAVLSHTRPDGAAGQHFTLMTLPVYCAASSGIAVEPTSSQFPRIYRST